MHGAERVNKTPIAQCIKSTKVSNTELKNDDITKKMNTGKKSLNADVHL